MANADIAAAPQRGPEIVDLGFADLSEALRLGWADFRAAPLFGVVFAGIYVVGGLFLTFVAGGLVWQTVILALGFPLLAPFAAVGLYEVSGRRQRSEPLDPGAIFGVVWRERSRQIPWLGAIIVIYILFYFFLAHMIFALFLGLSTMTNISTSTEVFLTGAGLQMILAELLLGGAMAWLLFMLMAFALPFALEREVDFVTAMATSFLTVQRNLKVMVVWSALIAVSILAAMLPAFLGLLLVLPVLGHATWHLYARALRHRDPVA